MAKYNLFLINNYISKIFTGLILLMFFAYKTSSGQSGKVINEDSIIKQKDIVDFTYTNFKINLRKDSSRLQKGYGPFYSIMPAPSYTLQSGFLVSLVSNITFYTDSIRNKLSNILLYLNYSQYQQYWLNLNSNIFFDKHKIHLYNDIRYYNFPTKTYGLGTRSSSSDALSIDYSYLRFYQIVFREIIANTFAGVGYNLDYHWNIKENGGQGKSLNDFVEFEKGTHSISSGVSVNALYDNRKNSVNPQGGFYAHVQYRPNMTLLGSDENWQSLLIDVRRYFKLPASSRNLLCFWSYNNLTLTGTPPYLDMPSIGWDDYSNTGRGYVPGRYTGNDLFYLESEYRFVITNNGLFGGVVFCNAESLLRKISTTIHTVIPGGGFGLRIKVNKYSNTNVCIDYGFGIGGSHGFFFNLGEVF